jgi:hypothetical protein
MILKLNNFIAHYSDAREFQNKGIRASFDDKSIDDTLGSMFNK